MSCRSCCTLVGEAGASERPVGTAGTDIAGEFSFAFYFAWDSGLIRISPNVGNGSAGNAK